MAIVEKRTLEEHLQAVTTTRMSESVVKALRGWGWLPYTDVSTSENRAGRPRADVFAVRATAQGITTLAVEMQLSKNHIGTNGSGQDQQQRAQSTPHVSIVCCPVGAIQQQSLPADRGLIEWCPWDESIRIAVQPNGTRIDA